MQCLGQAECGPSPSPAVKQSNTGSKQTTPTKSRSARAPQAGSSTDVKELCKELYNSVKDYTVSVVGQSFAKHEYVFVFLLKLTMIVDSKFAWALIHLSRGSQKTETPALCCEEAD